MMRVPLLLVGAMIATAAAAQDAPRFCPNRPDLGTSTCTTDRGRVLVEASVVDLEIDHDRGERHDMLLADDLLIRTGVDSRTEVQFGLTTFGRAVDVENGVRRRVTGIGDLRLGVRRNLLHPDGEGLSIAIESYLTLPTGRQPIGRDGASAGIVLPVEYEIGDKWDLAATGQVSAEKDQDGQGRHAATLGIVGLGYAVSDAVGLVGELAVSHDADPDAPSTQSFAAASIAWRVRPLLQLDLLVSAGLNHRSPDARVAVGGAVLF